MSYPSQHKSIGPRPGKRWAAAPLDADARAALVVGGTGNGTPSEEMMHQLVEQGIISDPDPVGVTYPADIWPLRGDLTLDQLVSVAQADPPPRPTSLDGVGTDRTTPATRVAGVNGPKTART